MSDTKFQMDEDDVDLKDIDMSGEGGSEDEDEWPDETMGIRPGLPTMYLTKIPKSLMEKWTKVNEGGMHLANVHVTTKKVDGYHHLTVVLPDDAKYDTTGESREFTFKVAEALPTRNTYVLADTVKRMEDGQPAPKRARSTLLAGRVAHTGALIPKFDDTYRRKVRERSRAVNQPRRSIIRVDDKAGSPSAPGSSKITQDASLIRGQANQKMLVSGSNRGTIGIDFSKEKPGKKAEFERYTRASRDELLDKLFSLFSEQPKWSFKDLRSRTEQPEVWLREVLSSIAEQPRSGPDANMWLLQSGFLISQQEAAPSGRSGGQKKEESQSDEEMGAAGGTNDDESSDEDSELEEVDS